MLTTCFSVLLLETSSQKVKNCLLYLYQLYNFNYAENLDV